MSGIRTPHEHDVLCGRGGKINRHIGNLTYRELVSLNKPKYFACKKPHKIKISQGIVRAIRGQDPPGRFLEQDSATGLWNDIGNKRAVEKTSQALREGQPKILRKITRPSRRSLAVSDANESISSAVTSLSDPSRRESTCLSVQDTTVPCIPISTDSVNEFPRNIDAFARSCSTSSTVHQEAMINGKGIPDDMLHKGLKSNDDADHEITNLIHQTFANPDDEFDDAIDEVMKNAPDDIFMFGMEQMNCHQTQVTQAACLSVNASREKEDYTTSLNSIALSSVTRGKRKNLNPLIFRNSAA